MTTQVMDTDVSGNTIPSTFRARAFQFTIHKLENYENFVKIFKDLKSCDFGISCKEICPNTKKEHIHLYTHFTQPYKLSRKILSFNNHIEICRGSPKQNIDYIEKDGNIIEEWGVRPRQGQLTISELKDLNKDETPAILYRIKNDIDEKENDKKVFFEMLDEIQNDSLKGPEIIYITGESGKGKTYSAYKIALEKFNKEKIGKLTCKNEFIDIINEEAECFVIEEFRPSQIKASDFLQLTDKYGYRCNIKGSFKTLRPKMIIICSIIRPENLYRDEEINEQFLRRITSIIEK